MLPRHPHMGRVPPGRHGDPALLLEEPVHIIGKTPLGPAPHDLAGVEPLVDDAGRVHAVAVTAQRDRAFPWPHVEPAGLEHHLLARVALQLRPRPERELGQLHVVRRVVGEADDPRVILRLAPHVAQLELLEPEDFGPRPARQPVGRRAAEAAETEDYVLEVEFHKPKSVKSER